MPPAKKQYHLALGPGDVAENIILCGDPARIQLAESFLSRVTLRRTNREFVTITGSYKNKRVTVISTGIGPDNMEITLVELSQIVKDPRLIRVGTCGALSKKTNLGDLVISTASMRLENTTGYFVPKGYPAVADYCIVGQLASICAKLQVTYHVGITASAPGFYGAQSRTVEPFRPRFDLVKKLRRLNVLNFEMEISTLFVLSSIAGWRAGAICTVFANRELDTFIAPSKKANAERTALLAALEAIASLK